jgi:hypothetical protein
MLDQFDVNAAHCLSPNEEFKIRQILHCIGQERIAELQEAIRTVVLYKIKILKRWAFAAGMVDGVGKALRACQAFVVPPVAPSRQGGKLGGGGSTKSARARKSGTVRRIRAAAVNCPMPCPTKNAREPGPEQPGQGSRWWKGE